MFFLSEKLIVNITKPYLKILFKKLFQSIQEGYKKNI